MPEINGWVGAGVLVGAMVAVVSVSMLLEHWSEPFGPPPGRSWWASWSGAAPWRGDAGSVGGEELGVLFALYAVSGRPEARRVSGWVRSRACPPGWDPARYGPDVSLRDRRGRIRELLGCGEAGVAWVAPADGAVVERSLARRAVADDVLAALVVLWQAVRDGEALGAGERGAARRAVAELGDGAHGAVGREVAKVGAWLDAGLCGAGAAPVAGDVAEHVAAAGVPGGEWVEVRLVPADQWRRRVGGVRGAVGDAARVVRCGGGLSPVVLWPGRCGDGGVPGASVRAPLR